MYSISDYGDMITNKIRMDAYIQALRQVVTPESVVLDVGTGTGVFALLACQFGARHVFALEPNEAIHVARQAARANGYGERITFIQDLSTNITLPEQADVVLSDMRGILPLYQNHIPSIVDLRERHLAPQGTLIPQQDRLWAAVVQVPEWYHHLTTPWHRNGYGLDLQTASSFVLNRWHRGRVMPDMLLVEPQVWATLDYRSIESPNVRSRVSWDMEGEGVAHGLLVWFDTMLADGIGFSNAPSEPELVYGSAFFPWLEPVTLLPDDAVSVELEARLFGGQYLWRWRTSVRAANEPTSIKARFDQSTFYSKPLSLSQFRKGAANYRPRLSEKGQHVQFILDLMARGISLSEIAEQLMSDYPQRYTNWQRAISDVSQLSQKYSD